MKKKTEASERGTGFTLIVAIDNFYLKRNIAQINLKVICMRRKKSAAEEN